MRLGRGNVGGQGLEQQEAVARGLDRQTDRNGLGAIVWEAEPSMVLSKMWWLGWSEAGVVTSLVSPMCPFLCPHLSLQAASGGPMGWERSR